MRMTSALVITILLACCGVSFGQFDPFNQFDGEAEFGPEGRPMVDPRMTTAEQAYHRGDYGAVITITTEIIQSIPPDPAPLHLRASAKIELGRGRKSSQQIRDGIADARLALSMSGKTQSWLYVPYMYGMSGLAEVENRPEHAKVAIGVLKTVLERPELTEVVKSQLLFQRGLAYLAAGDKPAALADLNATLALNRKHQAAYVKRAQTQNSQGNVKAALDGLNTATQNLPNSPMLFNERGMLQRANGDLPKAIADFTAALRLDPKFAVSYINRGVCQLDQRSAAGAEQDFTEALKLDPQNWGGYQFRGSARAAQGKLQEALNDFSASLKLNPTSALTLQERGFVRFAREEFTDAAKDFAAALSHDPKAIHLVPWRSMSLLRAGQADDASAALDELLKRPAEETGWVGTLASYLKDTVDEEALLKAAVDDKGKTSALRQCEAQFFIGQKKLQGGDRPGAKEQFAKAAKANLPNLAAFRCAQVALTSKK